MKRTRQSEEGSSRYSMLLRDPRWQRRRLEIFNRDQWACTRCGNDKSELHVHHLHYYRGRLPWEYPDDCLATVCDPCHKGEHARNSFEMEEAPLPVLAKGVVIPWVSCEGHEPYEVIPWTGQAYRESHPERPTIYICLDKQGREFCINNSVCRAFTLPFDAEAARELVRHGEMELAT